MNLPTPSQNAREAAHLTGCERIPVARCVTSENTDLTVRGNTRVRTRISIFRYPSPYGCSDCVPLGTPAFSVRSPYFKADRRGAAQIRRAGQIRFSPDQKPAFCAPEAEKNRKGISTCTSSQSRVFARRGSSPWAPVARPPQNKLSLARAQAWPRPQFSMAACLRAPSSVAPVTWFTAKKTPASVTDPILRGAFARLNRLHKTIVSVMGVGGLFVSKCLQVTAGQEPEGT